ncbi:hypothetical protein SAMN05880590_11185 [Rhizobium sp. RU35A]|uniref:hypothetical protein n=1 Tax=Rhizobium sp. RU35A TaxID=1907414 RepID=UPI0009553371|nr:hypothetical protein [Rhizobium sp. RU35A]SIR06441.1 hypothetical protein SAMN05880590_11185 [Rhizobium sp. RU35A]
MDINTPKTPVGARPALAAMLDELQLNERATAALDAEWMGFRRRHSPENFDSLPLGEKAQIEMRIREMPEARNICSAMAKREAAAEALRKKIMAFPCQNFADAQLKYDFAKGWLWSGEAELWADESIAMLQSLYSLLRDPPAPSVPAPVDVANDPLGVNVDRIYDDVREALAMVRLMHQSLVQVSMAPMRGIPMEVVDNLGDLRRCSEVVARGLSGVLTRIDNAIEAASEGSDDKVGILAGEANHG